MFYCIKADLIQHYQTFIGLYVIINLKNLEVINITVKNRQTCRMEIEIQDN